MGSAEEQALKTRETRGGRTAISLPAHIAYYDDRYQGAKARAMKEPERLASEFYANVPRAFFVLLPLFASLPELFYRKQGLLIDHLASASSTSWRSSHRSRCSSARPSCSSESTERRTGRLPRPATPAPHDARGRTT